jgi:hypothetical protein
MHALESSFVPAVPNTPSHELLADCMYLILIQNGRNRIFSHDVVTRGTLEACTHASGAVNTKFVL